MTHENLVESSIPAPVHVIAARHIDPGTDRLALDLPGGMTLREIVTAAIPGARADEIRQCRVALVTDQGQWIVPPENWDRVRPRPGVRVVIRALAGKNALRSILSIVVTIAAFAAGQIWGAKFGTMLLPGVSVATRVAIGTAIVGMGVSVIGTLLINALVPPVKPESRTAENRYSISGWKNVIDPNGAVPDIMGQLRVAPPFAALPHTEIVGDFQYIRALFCLGYGPLEIDDLRIGETSISEFSDIDIEIRNGEPGDLPVSLFPRQIAEEAIGVDLVRPLPRDELGEVIDGGSGIDTPVVRTTGADAEGASVIIAFPGGMVRFDDEGRSRAETVKIRIEHRHVQAEDWLPVADLDITAKKLESFYRQHTWTFPGRGRWQVRLTMLTDETTDTKRQRRASWVALQTLRPEYPLAFSKPLALVALRVKATYQLSGALDNFNALVRRRCLDWDHTSATWVARVTSNPASLFRLALQGPASSRPTSDGGIDLEALQDWHDFCRLKDLKYDRELVDSGSLQRDVLAGIASAGRAAPRHDGLRWSVVVDRPDLPIIDHLSPRNSSVHRSRRTYIRYPDAFRIPFLDATNDYKPAERFVKRPGFTGDVELTEELPMSGKTDPAEVWREGLRRWYEIMLRPDTYEVTQAAPLRVATRGDHIALSTPVLDRVLTAARVRTITGRLVELDDTVVFDDGQTYAIRYRAYDADDDFGRSVVRTVLRAGGDGETSLLTLAGSDEDMPTPGEIIHFGPAGEESYRLLVTGVEAGEGLSSLLRAVDAAPQIDALVDAAEIPAWSGRVGAEIDDNLLEPPAPVITSVATTAPGVAGAASGTLTVLMQPGPGPVSIARFELYHRLVGQPEWTRLDIPAASGGIPISGFDGGDQVEFRARAISIHAVPGPYTATLSITINGGVLDLPDSLDAEAISLTTLYGGVLIQFGTGPDDKLARVQVYRATTATLDREADAAGPPLDVAPAQTYSAALGDTSRSNLIGGGGLNDPGPWTAGPGWTIAEGQAVHAPGAAGALSQAAPLIAARYYRIGIEVVAMTAGTITPALTGGATVPGATASTAGLLLNRLQAGSGSGGLAVTASADSDAVLESVVIYAETAACLAQGIHYIWLEPQTADGLPGPVSGPFVVTIV
ncbi:TipJ family phage tail tip protein [Pseudogemmobacter sonorensis]|uniref:TipJ family phage tail tip protein n=1 Tax=Pseudogemmobacter sonorensis TaxID=2989681 RepID=UPI00367EBB3C